MDAPAGESALLLGTPVRATFMVVRRTRLLNGRGITDVRLERVRLRRVLRRCTDVVRLYGPPLSFVEGERVEAWVRLSPARTTSGAPRRLNGTLKSALLVRRRRSEPGLRRIHGSLRALVLHRLDAALASAGASARASGLARAMLLGERDQLPEGTRPRLEAGGAAHTLAISGLHMGILVLGTRRFLRLAGVGSRSASLILVMLVPAYVALVPVRPSVARAACMSLAGPVASLLGRRCDPLNILGGAALVLLAGDARLSSDAGFALSFAVTGALLSMKRTASVGPVARACEAFAASGAATAASLPLTAFHFGRAVPVAVVSNLVAIPAAAGLVGSAAACTLLALVHPALAAPLVPVLEISAGLLMASSDLFARLPGSAWWTPTGRPLLCGAALAVLLAFLRLRQGRLLPAVLVLQGLVMSGAFPPAPLPAARLSLRALDVGQGDALLVGLPDGGAVLVDGGGRLEGNRELARRVVIPALRNAGIRRLRAVVVSHWDLDHVGTLEYVLEAVPAAELWVPAIPPAVPVASRLVGRAVEGGAAVRSLTAGDILERGGTRWACLHPSRRGKRTAKNAQSLVLRVSGATGALLLTGDLESAGEALLLAAGRPLAADVLKVGHHGSRGATSREWLAAVSPEMAVISCGRRNPWGHPAGEVLGRIEAAGAHILRTDRLGTLTVVLEEAGPVRVQPVRGASPVP